MLIKSIVVLTKKQIAIVEFEIYVTDSTGFTVLSALQALPMIIPLR